MKATYWIIIALVAAIIGLVSYRFGILTRNAELVVFLVGVIGAFGFLASMIQKSNDLFLD